MVKGNETQTRRRQINPIKMLGSVQISGEELGDIETNDICSSLRQNSIRLLSIRGCKLHDKNYRQIMESLKENSSLSHLNLNLGVVDSKERVIWLSEGLKNNTGIETLLLHGNPIRDEGLSILVPALEKHQGISNLDLGDCLIGDDGLAALCGLAKPSNKKNSSLLQLTLTGNRDITQSGWAQLAMSLAYCTNLNKLYLDYNNIGDFGAGLFAVSLSAAKSLEYIDFEGCGITDAGAELLCDAIESYNITLHDLNLAENDVSEEIIKELKECLQENKTHKYSP